MLARKSNRRGDLDLLAYHVLHEGRRMGPYDRRTIIGLRIKNTLNGEHLLEASDGSRLTVAQLIGRPSPAGDFNAMRSGSYTSAKHTCSASLVDSESGPVEIPAFRGEVEVRVHSDVLRIAGTHRGGLGRGLKDGRVKLPLKDIVHARTAGSRVDLWLRSGDAPAAANKLQRFALDLFSDESAGELLQWLPDAKPWPQAAPTPSAAKDNASVSPLLWAAVVGIALVAAIVLLVVLRPRF
jgi:hypothetical protein